MRTPPGSFLPRADDRPALRVSPGRVAGVHARSTGSSSVEYAVIVTMLAALLTLGVGVGATTYLAQAISCLATSLVDSTVTCAPDPPAAPTPPAESPGAPSPERPIG